MSSPSHFFSPISCHLPPQRAGPIHKDQLVVLEPTTLLLTFVPWLFPPKKSILNSLHLAHCSSSIQLQLRCFPETPCNQEVHEKMCSLYHPELT